MDSDDSQQHMIYYLQSEVCRLKQEIQFLREQLEYKSLGLPHEKENEQS